MLFQSLYHILKLYHISNILPRTKRKCVTSCNGIHFSYIKFVHMHFAWRSHLTEAIND